MVWLSIWTVGVLGGGGLYLVARAIGQVAYQMERANSLRELEAANAKSGPQVTDK